jgi:putative ABC transport system permease protein
MTMSLVLTLASRNLFQDRLRFIATLIGIVFSVVLVMVQMGLYLGFGRMVTTMIDHADADLWVVSKGATSFEDLTLLDIKTRDRLPRLNSVTAVIPVLIGFADWRRKTDGRVKPVFVIGSDLDARALVPWNLVDGNLDALRANNAVAVDRTYFDDLGVSGVDSTAEIRGQPATVAAVTEGIRSFTTTPYVFADLAHARAYTGLPPTKFNHFMIRLKPGADVKGVQHDMQSAVPDADVLTTAQFRDRSRSFWLFGTGAGAALFAGALLGVIVGTVIVAQTLYSSTKDHLYEFATLRAIGCSNRYIYRVIIWQALLNAVIGFVLATAIGYVVVWVTAKSALPIVITPALVGGLFGLTIVMCVGSAVTAIIRVVRIDPVMVMSR